MAIKINDIPPEGLSIELTQKLDLFNKKGAPASQVTAVLFIQPTGGGGFHITGRIQADPLLECSRCLKTFPYHIDTEVNIDLASTSDWGSAPEHELKRSELDTEFYQGDEIDEGEFIKEQVLIAIPMVPLHQPDCKGLCPVCGTDLNEAECGCQKDKPGESGAFSALKDLLKK